MGLKKNNPGCECCGPADCDGPAVCLFPCTGDDCVYPCIIDIQMPIPDNTEVDELLGGSDPSCPQSAPCYACYRIWDRQFMFEPTNGKFFSQLSTCRDWSMAFSVNSIFYGTDIRLYPENWNSVDSAYIAYLCWNTRDYACPYSEDQVPEDDPCFPSKIAISRPVLTISGVNWDGECGTVTIEVRHRVFDLSAGRDVIPIGEEGCTDYAWTDYTYQFQLQYCTCQELVDTQFTYIGVTSENSCKGEIVPDPCNVPEAVIKLKDAPCSQCSCFNCGYNTDEIFLSVSGPVFNGTVALKATFGGQELNTPLVDVACNYDGIIDFCDGCKASVTVYLYCLSCDKYRAEISIREGALGSNCIIRASGETESFDCGETVEFQITSSEGACDIGSHTFSLS